MSFIIQPYVDGDSITPSTFFQLWKEFEKTGFQSERPTVFVSEAGFAAWNGQADRIVIREVSHRSRVVVALAVGVADRIFSTLRRQADVERAFLIAGTSRGYPELTSWLMTRGHKVFVVAPSGFKAAYEGKATEFYSFVDVPHTPTYDHAEVLLPLLKKAWAIVTPLQSPDGFVSFSHVIARLKERMGPVEREALWLHAAGELGPWVRRLDFFEEKLSGTILLVKPKDGI